MHSTHTHNPKLTHPHTQASSYAHTSTSCLSLSASLTHAFPSDHQNVFTLLERLPPSTVFRNFGIQLKAVHRFDFLNQCLVDKSMLHHCSFSPKLLCFNRDLIHGSTPP
eukprot:TRINITY_DN68702_c0_g1_i1.p1 TRINITY_DN68702_c0_g1~~TRINITY_DN68702_c0_g1_i1.p1  ORF type:complete len:109 (+),score=15.85 TRINITY_DN68702_c0_g1_i1:88-414(+)